MCGIAGIIDYSRSTDIRFLTEKMLSVISYRGPDESGIFHSLFAALGNVRLSIIDIAGGQQPLSDSSGRYWITFNGEIFNYRELRNDLLKKGYTFKTSSDTEVLVQLFAIHKEKCLGMLNGQFSFVIWDKQDEVLFIARDRVGIRPFFYNITNGVFYFASEIKSIFQNGCIKREIRVDSLSQISTFWTTITPNTVFEGIYELPPGNFGYFSRTGLIVKKYWSFSFEPDKSISLNDALDNFHDIFSDAIKIRLRADVEVAAYLSGGIDSSATIAYIKDIEPGVLNTFSIGFTEKSFDESHYQNEAVNFFNTSHKSYLCSTSEIADYFPEVVWHSEIPLTRTAPTPMFLLAKLVRENNIKVIVTGEGSDELLAGYDIFKEAMIRSFWATQPDSKTRSQLFCRLYPYIPQISQSNSKMLKAFFGYKLKEVDNPFYSHLIRWNNSNYIKKHFSKGIKNALKGYSDLDIITEKLPENFSSWDLLSKSQWLETTIFMSGYLLSSQGDRMSMANSVEGRYPFLDYRLIEFCNTLNSNLKLKGLNEKFLLKKLLINKIPGSIIRRSKQPYRAPVKNVFLSDNSPDYVHEMLSEAFTNRAGLFNFESVNSVLSRIKKTGTSSEMDDMLISVIISSHLLFNQFVENKNNSFKLRNLNRLRIISDI